MKCASCLPICPITRSPPYSSLSPLSPPPPAFLLVLLFDKTTNLPSIGPAQSIASRFLDRLSAKQEQRIATNRGNDDLNVRMGGDEVCLKGREKRDHLLREKPNIERDGGRSWHERFLEVSKDYLGKYVEKIFSWRRRGERGEASRSQLRISDLLPVRTALRLPQIATTPRRTIWANARKTVCRAFNV